MDFISPRGTWVKTAEQEKDPFFNNGWAASDKPARNSTSRKENSGRLLPNRASMGQKRKSNTPLVERVEPQKRAKSDWLIDTPTSSLKSCPTRSPKPEPAPWCSPASASFSSVTQSDLEDELEQFDDRALSDTIAYTEAQTALPYALESRQQVESRLSTGKESPKIQRQKLPSPVWVNDGSDEPWTAFKAFKYNLIYWFPTSHISDADIKLNFHEEIQKPGRFEKWSQKAEERKLEEEQIRIEKEHRRIEDEQKRIEAEQETRKRKHLEASKLFMKNVAPTTAKLNKSF